MYKIKVVGTDEVLQGLSISSMARRKWGSLVVVQPETADRYEVVGPLDRRTNNRPIIATLWVDPREEVPFDMPGRSIR